MADLPKKSEAEHHELQNGELAGLANEDEHQTGKLQCVKQYPLACCWSLFAVWCTLLVSFENQAAGSIIGIPEFRKDFGYLYEGSYVLRAQWQSAFQGAPVASGMLGALGCGYIADWIGRRAVIMICLVITYAAVTMEFVATTDGLFFGGKFLNGFVVGALASVTVSYIGEVSPLALRGVLTCLSALAYTLGPLVVAIIVNATGTYNSRWAYRGVFCAQYGFAVIATIFIPFMPESPWWLASKGRQDKALRALHRLSSKGAEGERKLAAINRTLEEIKRETDDATYLECFRKTNLRRTIVSIAPLCIQALSGVVFCASYSTYYIQLAGYSTSSSFRLQIIQQVLSLIGNIMSWFLVDKFGRRNLTFYGLLILTVVLWLMGGLATAGTKGTIKGTISMIMVYCWWYNVTIGATAYTILCEVSTSRLRIKTIAIGLAVQNAINMVWSFVLPYLFNTDKANLGARVAFIFGGLAILSLVFLWVYLPETAGRTYEELDEMFVKKIPARKFAGYQTDTQASGQAMKRELEDEK